jgi:hypothetical protein
MIGILIVAGLAAVVVATLAPFFLPWHQRLRWLIAASTVPDPCGLASMPWSGLEELAVKTVSPYRGGLLIVAESGPAGSPRWLWLDCVTTQDAAHLEWSAAAGVPLLLIGDAGGGLSLHGPTWSVSGLQGRRGPAWTPTLSYGPDR